MKRDHVPLCSYNPKNRDLGKTIPTPSVAGVKRARTPDSASDHSGRKEDGWPRTTGKSKFMIHLPKIIVPSFQVFEILPSPVPIASPSVPKAVSNTCEPDRIPKLMSL